MKNKIIFITVALSAAVLSSCLKSNEYYEDFSSTEAIADISLAPVYAIKQAAPTASWYVLDSLPGGVDYKTAVHINSKDHLGDITVRMKIDKDAANTWLATHPTYQLLPDSMYSVPSLDVVIPNAGVFTTGDFVVHINTGKGSPAVLKAFTNYILPISIDTVVTMPIKSAAQYRTIFWRIRVKP